MRQYRSSKDYGEPNLPSTSGITPARKKVTRLWRHVSNVPPQFMRLFHAGVILRFTTQRCLRSHQPKIEQAVDRAIEPLGDTFPADR